MTIDQQNAPIKPLLDKVQLARILNISEYQAKLTIKQACIDLQDYKTLAEVLVCSYNVAQKIIGGYDDSKY